MSGAASESRHGRLWGLFGQPYVDLEGLLDLPDLEAVDAEVALGLARVEARYTGGTLKWMGVAAPWVRDDEYADAMDVLARLPAEEMEVFLSLADERAAGAVPEAQARRYGDETDRPFSRAQELWLSYRHGAYFPWKVCYHLLENDAWDDKHSGEGKEFGEEARAVFPRTVALVESLPFTEVGRAVIFGLEPNDHATLHRDTEPGTALSVPQSISISPRGNKRLYLQNDPRDEPLVIQARAYWFNDMDYHGVLADPFFRYSIRVDGVLEPRFVAEVEASVTGLRGPDGPPPRHLRTRRGSVEDLRSSR